MKLGSISGQRKCAAEQQRPHGGPVARKEFGNVQATGSFLQKWDHTQKVCSTAETRISQESRQEAWDVWSTALDGHNHPQCTQNPTQGMPKNGQTDITAQIDRILAHSDRGRVVKGVGRTGQKVSRSFVGNAPKKARLVAAREAKGLRSKPPRRSPPRLRQMLQKYSQEDQDEEEPSKGV